VRGARPAQRLAAGALGNPKEEAIGESPLKKKPKVVWIRLAQVEEILYRETSVIAPDDVAGLMKVLRREAADEPFGGWLLPERRQRP